ncbi:sel1 repeat family protein [Sphingobacterium sp. DN00404]|uniref:Sel1 repeat family protein n=1 Tax=Sphingobacterium micropteri TaxID=2763501 RepID=A0ABR7YRL6_9SPHI|nr:SEL1-like repeat protein [Sphingobacterium micropteri]MBD1433907.1 sel1 repeat family protein [Sphingobacterium micropteri]
MLLCWLAVSPAVAQNQNDFTGFLEGAVTAAKLGAEKTFHTRIRYFATAIERNNITPQNLNEANQDLYRQAMYEGAIRKFNLSEQQYEQLLSFLAYKIEDNPPNMTSMGVLYQYGYGVEQNDIEAVKWYRKAAERETHGDRPISATCILMDKA